MSKFDKYKKSNSKFDKYKKSSSKFDANKLPTSKKKKDVADNFRAASTVNMEALNTVIIKNMSELYDLPERDQAVIILSRAYFNTISFLPYFFSKINLKEAYMSSYTVAQNTIDTFNLYVPKIEKFGLLCHNSLPKLRPDFHSELNGLVKNYNMKYILKRSHTKNHLFSDGQNFYSIIGSGNLTNNTKLESYVIFNNKKLYDFLLKNVFDETKDD